MDYIKMAPATSTILAAKQDRMPAILERDDIKTWLNRKA
jgi:putative SOS response-associated peptidase YedK